MITRFNVQDYQFNTVHIIGGGPSRHNLSYDEGLVISCHSPFHNSHILSTPDFRVGIPKLYNCPYIISHAIDLSGKYKTRLGKDAARDLYSDIKNISRIDKIYAINDWNIYYLDESSFGDTGIFTYIWVQHQNPTKIHLWGFDSLFDDTRPYLGLTEVTDISWLIAKPFRESDPDFLKTRKQHFSELLRDNTEVHT